MSGLYNKYCGLISLFLKGVSQNITDDLGQELRAKLFEVCEKIEIKKIVPNCVDDYIFICLSNCKKRFFKNNKSNSEILVLNEEEFEKKNYRHSAHYENMDDELINRIWVLAEVILTELELTYLRLHYHEGAKNKAIAQKFRVTPQSVSKILRRAVEKMKKCIDETLY